MNKLGYQYYGDVSVVTKDPYLARTFIFLTGKGLKIRQNTGHHIAALIYNDIS